ncbi:hypothetical protein BaRGS_00029542, partial [Batillaria attramentaria]
MGAPCLGLRVIKAVATREPAEQRVLLQPVSSERPVTSPLANPNVAVKKQVFEILAAISVYSKDGYARAMQVLERFK